MGRVLYNGTYIPEYRTVGVYRYVQFSTSLHAGVYDVYVCRTFLRTEYVVEVLEIFDLMFKRRFRGRSSMILPTAENPSPAKVLIVNTVPVSTVYTT